MPDEERHAMELISTHPTGVEEWYCPTCGYRFLMQWPPAYKKTILVEGDPTAMHSGGVGGVSMGVELVQPTQASTPNQDELNDPTLRPWIEWFEAVDFEKLWED